MNTEFNIFDVNNYDEELLEKSLLEEEGIVPNVEIDTESANKNSDEIMAEYNKGKMLKESAEPILRELLKKKGKEKIKTDELLMKTPDGIDSTQYKELVNTYLTGIQIMNSAKEKMIEKLDKFIYYVIERQFSTFKAYTKDLYQEGVLGILKGIDTYDPSKSKPTTFFFIYIIHEMTEFINLNVNKTTSHYSANIVKVKKAINHFEREGREWKINDIAQETGISAETIAQALNIMESANEMHYDSADFLDSQISQRNPSPEEEYLRNETSRLIHQAVKTLPIDEANVIILKYGLSGEEPMSYKNISNRLDIQIDKVKKLHSAGLRKLKRSKIINGNFKNLKREEKALNDTLIGVIPIKEAEAMMNDLDELFQQENA